MAERRARRVARWRRVFPWLLGGVLVALLAAVLWLDHRVRTAFEGQRWSLPARVYARPLTLYPGAAVSPDTVAATLGRLGYRAQGTGPGTWRRRERALLIHTRGFEFWDGVEPARRVMASFRAGQVVELLALDSGRALPMLRLEPLEYARIHPAHREDRELIRLDEAPPLLVAGLLWIEDRAFWRHGGVRPSAVLRAAWANLRAGRAVQGGSTITQQLVKNHFLDNRRTLWRKLVEALMAILLELHYDKREILEAYLNEVFLGQDGDRAIHGFGLAAWHYFDRPLGELDAAQLALLVALVRGPSHYDPRRHPARARARRDWVLEQWQAAGLLDAAAVQRARAEPLGLRPPRPRLRHPAYLDLVRRQLRRDYREADLRSAGLRIFTNLDPVVQGAAERALAGTLAGRAALQGAVVVTAPADGAVLAVVGDRQATRDGFNRALDARRPIGSLVKPAVVLAALSRPELYGPVTLVEDAPLALRQSDGSLWRPENDDGRVHGTVPLAHALVHSYNLAIARLGLALGVETVAETLRRLGLPEAPPAYPALLLGALELTPFEVATLYQTLANQGFRTPLRAVEAVTDAEGHRLQRYPLSVEPAFDPGVIHVLDRLLQLVVERGTARAAGQRLPELQAAGKTGTSDGNRDAWFAGFTGSHLAVVWVGRDDNAPAGVYGAQAALPVWIELMAAVDAEPLHLPRAANVETVWIDWQTGLRSRAGCDNAVQLAFIIGSAPAETAPCRGRSWFRRLFD
ncbi:MAG: penicillin-binding protein 1B [Gammaproteobacteria bacterium]|nr:MAG: penicillin-binding protein 1B [Gammaproteobacteria bacterium]